MSWHQTLSRADDESGVPRAHPSGHLLGSVVDADAVSELGDALGEGDQRLQCLAERSVLVADRLGARPSDSWAAFTSAGTFAARA